LQFQSRTQDQPDNFLSETLPGNLPDTEQGCSDPMVVTDQHSSEAWSCLREPGRHRSSTGLFLSQDTIVFSERAAFPFFHLRSLFRYPSNALLFRQYKKSPYCDRMSNKERTFLSAVCLSLLHA